MGIMVHSLLWVMQDFVHQNRRTPWEFYVLEAGASGFDFGGLGSIIGTLRGVGGGGVGGLNAHNKDLIRT